MKNCRILQIGGAALDAINYFKVGKRYSIDPLANFYKEKFKINYSGIELKEGFAESLPYSDNFFDIVIFANVLDHVQDPKKAISEIKRVLKKKGLLYLEVDVSNNFFISIYKFWKGLHKIFRKTFNKPHPHIFSKRDLNNFLEGKFNLTKEFKKIEINHGPILKFLSNIGIFKNIFYRALYSKGERR